MPPESLEQARERLRPYVEKASGFSGWMAYVQSKLIGAQRPWDYMQRAGELIQASASVLDIGTGGGERFAELCSDYRDRAVSTEAWGVNAVLAASRLHPLGIDFVYCDDERMPFADSSFDLILNRHASLDPKDVSRLLRPGGTLYTEQMWRHWNELGRFFPRALEYGAEVAVYLDQLAASGLQLVDSRGSVIPAAYDGLGDFVYMLCITPWTIPDFDPLGTDLEALLALERELTTSDGLVLSDGHYIIEARKPAS